MNHLPQGLTPSQIQQAVALARKFEERHKVNFPAPNIKLDEDTLILEWKDDLRHLEIYIHPKGVEWCYHHGRVFESEDFITDRTFDLVAKWS